MDSTTLELIKNSYSRIIEMKSYEGLALGDQVIIGNLYKRPTIKLGTVIKIHKNIIIVETENGETLNFSKTYRRSTTKIDNSWWGIGDPAKTQENYDRWIVDQEQTEEIRRHQNMKNAVNRLDPHTDKELILQVLAILGVS